MPFDSVEILVLLSLGLAAGALGGMLGIGGSILIIPGLTLLLATNQHLSQAVAMIINVFVAIPSMIQHARAGAVRRDVFIRMIPFGVVFILVGVAASNQIDAQMLKKFFGVFLLYVTATNIHQLFSKREETPLHEQRTGWFPVGCVGSLTGFLAGLLGIGGGIFSVPLLQRVVQLPLRQSIATTTAFMSCSAVIGSIHKTATLSSLANDNGSAFSLTWQNCFIIASLIAPTAILGGLFGGKLTHILPLNIVRIVFTLLIAWASANMLELI